MPHQCRRRLGRANSAQAHGPSLALAFRIGLCGSLDQRPLPNRPPTLQAFRSVLSRTPSVSTRRLFRVLVLTPVATEFNSGERGYSITFSSVRTGEFCPSRTVRHARLIRSVSTKFSSRSVGSISAANATTATIKDLFLDMDYSFFKSPSDVNLMSRHHPRPVSTALPSATASRG